MDGIKELRARLAVVAAERGIAMEALEAELAAHADEAAARLLTEREATETFDELARATAARLAAEASWRSAITAALALGASQRRVAAVAGCSRQWVARIAHDVAADEAATAPTPV